MQTCAYYQNGKCTFQPRPTCSRFRKPNVCSNPKIGEQLEIKFEIEKQLTLF